MNLSEPHWQDYCDLGQKLGLVGQPEEPPGVSALNGLLAADIQRANGKAIRFVNGNELPGVAYEEHIFQTGEISTRQNSWHDLFNALVWARFPRIKAAMNGRHFAEIQSFNGTDNSSGRGPVRDALTLFDECGVMLVSSRVEILQALVRRDWQGLFCAHRESWQEDCTVFVLGHALLEKFLKPYKAITAQVLTFHVDGGFMQQERELQRQCLDQQLAAQLRTAGRLRSSAELAPLPLMGIPGWWPADRQNEDFYADEKVFRPPPDSLMPAAILNLEKVL